LGRDAVLVPQLHGAGGRRATLFAVAIDVRPGIQVWQSLQRIGNSDNNLRVRGSTPPPLEATELLQHRLARFHTWRPSSGSRTRLPTSPPSTVPVSVGSARRSATYEINIWDDASEGLTLPAGPANPKQTTLMSLGAVIRPADGARAVEGEN